MNGREFEEMLSRELRRDLSVGTETFRDELLARCLNELNTGTGGDVIELKDSELELFSAAGDPSALVQKDLFLDGPATNGGRSGFHA